MSVEGMDNAAREAADELAGRVKEKVVLIINKQVYKL